jgi:nucleolin
VFRRFASDEAKSEEKSSVGSADGEEHGSVRSAIDSATESASTYAGEAAGSLSQSAEETRDAVAGTAAAVGTGARQAFAPREHNRESRPYGDRNGGRGRYDGGRGGYDNSRGNDRGGYGGDRRPDRYEDRQARPPMDRVLVPTPGIYVGNLLFDVTASDLEKEFEPFGTIKSAIIASDARGLSKG